MAFWDFVKDLAPTVLSVGATLYGANQKSKAADQSSQALIDAQNRATQAQLDAIAQAERIYNSQQQAASPGLLAVQRIISRGDELTPYQQDQINDARLQTLNALQGGSLRGSARATAETVRDVEGRMKNQFMESNRNRADTLAGNLSNQYFSSGNNAANANLKGGDSVSTGLLNTGIVDASNIMGQASTKGDAIGNITAVIADQIKQANQEKRDSSYKPLTINWDDGTTSTYRA